jgi:hypothetical protein
MEAPVSWLLNGPPWVQYRTQIDLLGESLDAPQVRKAHEAMLEHPQIQGLLAELAEWPWAPIGHHRNAGLLLHKLTFIADIGFRIDNLGIGSITQKILKYRSPNGIPYVLARAGKGQYFTWMLCDAPLILYALIKFGYSNDCRIQTAIDYLVSLKRHNGWPCAIEKKRGGDPVRNSDPCPYATLVMLKLLSLIKDSGYKDACQIGTEAILNLWAKSRKLHPHEFYMGTDFRKLKAPLVWYDILHVTEVLTQYQWTYRDSRLLEMVKIIKSKADSRGKFAPESVYQAWKGWDFGRRKEPSRWLTLLVQQIIMRIG